MTFWSAMRSMGTSSSSTASIPTGARRGADPTPNPRKPGHARARRAAGTATREVNEEALLLLGEVHQLDTGLLMGATTKGNQT